MAKRKKITIKKHLLMPKHTKISEAEKKKVLEEYNITIKELPNIYKDDPALSEIDVEDGDVIKITRKSPTAGESIFYRVVISG